MIGTVPALTPLPAGALLGAVRSRHPWVPHFHKPCPRVQCPCVPRSPGHERGHQPGPLSKKHVHVHLNAGQSRQLCRSGFRRGATLGLPQCPTGSPALGGGAGRGRVGGEALRARTLCSQRSRCLQDRLHPPSPPGALSTAAEPIPSRVGPGHREAPWTPSPAE